jgi:hypothetical protein
MSEEYFATRSKGKIILKIISAIIVPFLADIAIICITIQQNELNKANRDNELDIVQKQRHQEQSLAEHQRIKCFTKERCIISRLVSIYTYSI